MSLKEANKLFKDGNYEEAYLFYKQAELKHGNSIVSYNLKICKKYLGSNELENKDDSTIKRTENLDFITKILLDNSSEKKLTQTERQENLKLYKKAFQKKSEDATVKDVNPIPKDWPKDLELAPLPESTNDYNWKRPYKPNTINVKSETNALSIIIPTFNRSKILEVTLACLVNQKTNYKFEVIVADDGSKEDLSMVTRKFEDKLDIKLVRQRDYGYQLCAIRNLGLRTAKYEFVSILDCDMAPNILWVQSFMELLSKDDGVALIGLQH